MKYTTFKKGGYGTGLITTTGGDVYGRVFLSRDPEGAMEAATKNYADLSITALSASSFTTGTLAPARVPEFTGDIVKAVGGLGINYSDTGISTGTYPKISVDRKGRATGGGSLVESDLPDIAFSKITSGKPTTLAGYGILDALSVNGGTLSGRLTAQATGDLGESVITKGFVDTSNLGTAAIPLGSIVYKGGKGPFFGFLRANGATVSKTTYADLYAKIGDTYSVDLGVGAGKPWKQQYDFNSENGTLGAWTTGTPLPGTSAGWAGSQAIVTKNRVYLMGAGGASAAVYTTPINEDGTLGDWITTTPLLGNVTDSQAIVIKNRVYLLGGYSNLSGRLTTVYTAPIDEDGTLGAWTTSTPLPIPLILSQAIVTSKQVYLIGGLDNNHGMLGVYTAPIDEDGTLGAWTTSTPLPVNCAASQAIVTKNRVYLLGGYSGNGPVSAVYTAIIKYDGTLGAWTTSTPLPEALDYSQAIVTKNQVYLIGGRAVGGYSAAVYTAPINENGTLGAWTTSTPLPVGMYNSQAIVTKNRLYMLGGYATNAVYTASFSGGTNDYTPYNSGTFVNTEPGQFRLPEIPQNNLELDAWIKA